jgi:hypothetical protein
MNLPKLTRISVLCLIAFITVLTVPAQAAPRCGCAYCTQDPTRDCNLDGQASTCAYFLSVALCPAGSTNSPADSTSRVDGSFLTLQSELMQEPLGCMISGN